MRRGKSQLEVCGAKTTTHLASGGGSPTRRNPHARSSRTESRCLRRGRWPGRWGWRAPALSASLAIHRVLHAGVGSVSSRRVSWSLSRFDYAIGFGGASHVGNVRQSNQDAWRADPSAGLFAVADGMGDTADGALAASVSLDHCFARLRASDALAICDRHLQAPTLETRAAVLQLLESCVREADETVKSVSRRPRHPSAPGCTLELLLLLGRHGFIVHVGHSRVYLVRPQATIQITSDHTVQNSLLAVGVGTISEPPPARPALTSVLGRSERLSVDPAFVELTPGDRLVLCTDGVHDELDSERELGELARRGTPEEAAVVLINAALSRAGGDNATAIVVGVGEERLRRESSDGGLAARDFAYA